MRQKGFIKLILFIVIGVIILGVLKVDVRSILSRPEVAQNISFVREKGKDLWVVTRPARLWIAGAFITYVVHPFEKANEATSTPVQAS